MKTNTIRWKIFKYNLILIILLITVVTLIFNIAIRLYMEKDIASQIDKIASRAEDTTLRQGHDFLKNGSHLIPPNDNHHNKEPKDIYRFYFIIDRSLKQPLSVLNANFILLDKDKNIINPFNEDYFSNSKELVSKLGNEIDKLKRSTNQTYTKFKLPDGEYIAVIKQVSQKNSFGLEYIVIYSSLQKLNQLQLATNLILLAILFFAGLIIIIFSSRLSKKITAPFKVLDEHIKAISKRNFGSKITIPVDEELQEFVNNINIMSEKLEVHDKAQKTFMQNASHEFRTPLMSIQSYAEGIKYNVVDTDSATQIIIDESKRMTHLVEDLLYLSRLDSIEENYNFKKLDFNDVIYSCIERVNAIAIKNNITIIFNSSHKKVETYIDREKFSRAIINVISNCLRYATSTITIDLIYSKNTIELSISDDGPGFDSNELPNIFERFYKGKNGKFGLGLAIARSIIERHNGRITANNTDTGAKYIIKCTLL